MRRLFLCFAAHNLIDLLCFPILGEKLDGNEEKGSKENQHAQVQPEGLKVC
jgi:hypothetical protein